MDLKIDDDDSMLDELEGIVDGMIIGILVLKTGINNIDSTLDMAYTVISSKNKM